MTNFDPGDLLASKYLRAVAEEYNWPEYQPVERTLAIIDPAAVMRELALFQKRQEIQLGI